MSTHPPLHGRVALVTGVSRPNGIAATVAKRLNAMGATVVATGFPPHDAEMPWGEGQLDTPFPLLQHNLEEPDAPAVLIDEAFDAHGQLDIVAAVHARSSSQSLDQLTVGELQRSWAANVQSVLLLAQQFARRHQPAPPDHPPAGRMLWFTSGQHFGPMESELPYAVTKGALHQMTASVDKALSQHRIVANCINPGPVDTGWATPELHQAVTDMFPDKRWGTPDDVANLVAFLVSDEGAWIRGQVLNSEGGFNRFG